MHADAWRLSSALSVLLIAAPIVAVAQSYTFTTIDVLSAGANGTSPFGINTPGQIVGSYSDAAGTGHGFLDSGGTIGVIDVPFPGVTQTAAAGINARGQIVGNYSDATGTHGFLDAAETSPRSMCHLPALS
jgi:uncharacterized membrane protein